MYVLLFDEYRKRNYKAMRVCFEIILFAAKSLQTLCSLTDKAREYILPL